MGEREDAFCLRGQAELEDACAGDCTPSKRDLTAKFLILETRSKLRKLDSRRKCRKQAVQLIQFCF